MSVPVPGQSRIGAQTSLNFLPFHGEQVLLCCQQNRITSQRLIHRLLHSDWGSEEVEDPARSSSERQIAPRRAIV